MGIWLSQILIIKNNKFEINSLLLKYQIEILKVYIIFLENNKIKTKLSNWVNYIKIIMYFLNNKIIKIKLKM